MGFIITASKVNAILVWMYLNDLLLIPLLIGAFAIRVYLINLPGPYGDEILVALPAYQMRWGQVPHLYNLFLFDRWLPVSIGPHTGALSIYAQFLFSFIAGGYWFGYRLLNVIYAIIAIVLTYFFAREFIGRRAALISALLLAFMPSFVFYSRVGDFVLFLRVVLSSGMLFCFYRWWRTGIWKFFYVGCLIIGFGFSTRLEIVWWLTAVPIYAIIANREVLQEIWVRLKTHLPQALAGMGWFFIGATLFVAYNVVSRGETFNYIFENMYITSAGQDNLSFFQNLYIRFENLITLLNGSAGDNFGVMGRNFENSLYPIAFFLSIGLISCRVFLQRWRGSPEEK